MKKIITALLNEKVHEKLKEYQEINVLLNDIQYQEGIIEALEINKEIEYIILSELLPGELNLKELIEKIKKINNNIKIIIILEKENKELENYLFTKGNINIFYNNEIEIKDIVNLIINKKQNEELQKEIEEIKKIIFNKNNFEENNNIEKYKNNSNEIYKNKEELKISKEEKARIEKEIENEFAENLFINKIKNKINNIFNKEKIKEETKIITFLGISGVGKSISIINLAKELQKTKNKILIIDLDFFNNSIETLLQIPSIKYKYKLEEQKNDFEKLTIKINSKIDLISKINLISESQFEENNILKIIKKLKDKYDLILIDTGNDYKNNYLKILINESEKIVFITEPNIIQIKKSKKLLEQHIQENKIEKSNTYILFNKIKNDTISFDILKNVFKEYNILGEINFIKNCNTLINQSMNEIFLEKEIKKQYKKIGRRILQNNELKKYYLEKMEKIFK